MREPRRESSVEILTRQRRSQRGKAATIFRISRSNAKRKINLRTWHPARAPREDSLWILWQAAQILKVVGQSQTSRRRCRRRSNCSTRQNMKDPAGWWVAYFGNIQAMICNKKNDGCESSPSRVAITLYSSLSCHEETCSVSRLATCPFSK